jgi:hypothetical protein
MYLLRTTYVNTATARTPHARTRTRTTAHALLHSEGVELGQGEVVDRGEEERAVRGDGQQRERQEAISGARFEFLRQTEVPRAAPLAHLEEVQPTTVAHT